jgi:hypothetical protein
MGGRERDKERKREFEQRNSHDGGSQGAARKNRLRITMRTSREREAKRQWESG